MHRFYYVIAEVDIRIAVGSCLELWELLAGDYHEYKVYQPFK